MIHLHLFGAATPSGEAFRRCVAGQAHALRLVGYSRHPDPSEAWLQQADLHSPGSFHPAGGQAGPVIWISFAPIWLLAPFLAQLAADHPARLAGLGTVIACSSSSAITKRFAVNQHDRELVARLLAAEELLLATTSGLGVGCRILRPTLIYGRVGPYADRNLSRLVQLMRRLPVLPLPCRSGFRQPIHASQLAAVAWHLAQQAAGPGWAADLPERIGLGGDSELSYVAMLKALQQALPPGDPARRCRLLQLPPRLFYAAALPVLLHSPRAFEALLRMGSDLSGFTPSHCLLDTSPQRFPLLPLL